MNRAGVVIVTPSRAERLRARLARTEWDRYDTVFVVMAAILTCAVHPIQRLLERPYWVDEAWVAVLGKAPLGRLADLGSSSPVGFLALLRSVPGSGLQRGRLVVLAFSALTVVMAYVVPRALVWPSRGAARTAALAAALMVMLAPFSLLRNDLKQYTCDGFCALFLLAVGGWTERSEKRSRILWLAAAVVLVAPFSSTSAFVSIAVFAGLFLSALFERDWKRARWLVGAGMVAGAVLVWYFGALVVANLNPQLRAYWNGWYLTGSWSHRFTLSWQRLVHLRTALAMPAAVFVAFFVIGIIVLVRLRARALAIAVVLLWVEMFVVASLRRYPFLDLRTSHYLLAASFMTVAIGAVGLLGGIVRMRLIMSPFLSSAFVLVVGAVLVGLYAYGSVPRVGQVHIPVEDVRAETLAVAAQHRDRDVIVVGAAASFGFSYYWPHGRVTFAKAASAQGFRAQVAGVDAIYVRDRDYPDVLAALREAAARRRRAGAGSRLFIVRVHLSAQEAAIWHRALDHLHLEPRTADVGSDPLLVVGGR